MDTICLIHWKASEAREKVTSLRRAGYRISLLSKEPDDLRRLGKRPLRAIVIDLSRLPSQGRDVALFLRQRKNTRNVPIFFVGGEVLKVRRIKKILPDESYTTWRNIKNALRRVGGKAQPVFFAHRSVMAGYAGTPLLKKLGIASGLRIGLVTPPRNLRTLLGNLPSGVILSKRLDRQTDMILWFVRSTVDLRALIGTIVPYVGKGGIWIAWRKKVSRTASDLSQTDVRRVGLASGLVDYKIASIDDTWSGLRFALRKKKFTS